MKKLFAILIMCSLSLPVLAIEGQEGETAQTGSLEVLTTEEVNELNNQQAPVIDEPSAPDVAYTTRFVMLLQPQNRFRQKARNRLILRLI